jgi:tRNA(Ile)-lysidine synthase
VSALVDRLGDFFRRRLGERASAGVIAISGGPDSVALAWLALALQERGIISQPVLAHLNHRLRGAESDGDEAFVIELANRWGVPVVTESIDVAELARGRNLEETARQVRYAWLTQVARQHAAAWIATGHTTDDQAETVLHHFLRGAGLNGLSGIAERLPLADDILLLRPLLTTRRHELTALLDADKITFRVDSSNSDVRFTRNRLRREIIPLLEREINPALVDVLARMATQAQECQAAVAALAGDYLEQAEQPRADGVLVFSRSKLAALAPFWAREVFRLVWRREGWPMGAMNADDWRRLDGLVDGSLPRHDFPGGVHGRGGRHVVQLWREPLGEQTQLTALS